MDSGSDPVEAADDGRRDLYEVATWERRTALDRLSVATYWLVSRAAKAVVALIGLFILVVLFAQFGTGVLFDPVLGALVALSALPALALAAYVWYTDVTSREPATLLIATFLLAVLTASFAAVLNGIARPAFAAFGILGLTAYFFLVVGPVEETVKLLAVRLYAYTDSRFGTVIDGAVYGAAAGLGFATIENALFILRSVDPIELSAGLAAVAAGDGIAGVRALAGPGHVIYSAFAGYYLGLAKFNPGSRGPIVIKGLIVAAFIHGLYNSTVGVATGAVTALTPLTFFPAFVLFVLAFQGTFGWLLFRKLQRYRRCYRDLHGGPDDPDPELAEFDP